jgi:hypothetical protein
VESDYQIIQISDKQVSSAVHAYFDLCPESPDGQEVTYFGFDDQRPGPGQVMACHRDGTAHQIVGRAPRGGANGGALQQWVGKDLIAYRSRVDGNAMTQVVSLADGSVRSIPGALRMFSPVNGLGLYASRHAARSGVERSDEAVYSLELESGESRPLFTMADVVELHPLADSFTEEDPVHFTHTKWSHDGTQMFAVVTNEMYIWRGGKSKLIKSLVLASADGSDLRYLTEFGHHPMWGPGDAFLHTFDRLPEGGQAFVAHPLDGSAPYSIFPEAPGVHPSFDPAGQYVVTDVFRWPEPGQGAILLYDVSSGEYQVLSRFATPDTTHETGVHPHPVWSRDGKRVYFNVAETNVPHLYAIDL